VKLVKKIFKGPFVRKAIQKNGNKNNRKSSISPKVVYSNNN
jgi:hypothetical protein